MVAAKRARRTLFLALLLCTWISPVQAASGWGARTETDDVIAKLMAQMTPAQKVGQLFIVAFWGRNPSPASRAGQLIQEYKIGGVVLLTSNNNIANSGTNTPADVALLSNNLQSMAMGWDLTGGAGSGIPLFVAIDHEGDGFPYMRITNGTTPLPNPMAIGATWDLRYAEQAGAITGRELAEMGINMLLGPVVDVLDDPRPGGKGDIGTRVFGGDPYWVSEMGRAYVRGVHAGSSGKVLTVAKHFPGHGGSDRLPDDEVATVDKSLQELKRVELAPFFAVTQPKDPDGLDRADAMMTSHIRYRGFYGDIRQFTRPISFDAENLGALLALPEFQEWKKEGVLVSDSLGVPAVRKYFDPELKTFPHRQIAREAFLAGNDLLILSQFALVADWEQQFNNTVEAIEYFRETYESDPTFAARVDDAVARILRLKLKLYPLDASQADGGWAQALTAEQLLVGAQGLSRVAEGTALVDEIARRAATVLYPTEDSLPPPPRSNEDILILADERPIRECFDADPVCDPHPLVPPGAVEEAILRLYGPGGTGQVAAERVHTRTYAELKALLTWPGAEGTEEQPPGDVGQLLEEAEWIVFTMFEPNPKYADSDALQLFLAQNAHHIYHANVVVLAYTAPYYLDATEISKLTAYYVFYAKTQPFIEASVRTLFGEVKPQGRSPVSIEGTYYDLSTQLSPDPAQQIVLTRTAPDEPVPFAPLKAQVRTSVIRDRNGHPVPDGTQVRFVARVGARGANAGPSAPPGQMIDSEMSPTVDGIAEAELSIDRPGLVTIAASSGDTAEGPPLTFEVPAEPMPTPVPATPTATVTPTPTPRPSPTAKPASTATAVPSPTATPLPSATPTSEPLALAALIDTWEGHPPDLGGVLGACLIAAGIGYLWRGRRAGASRRVRLALLAWVGGLIGYLAYGWKWIPVRQWIAWPTWIASGLLALGGAIVLIAGAEVVSRTRKGNTPRAQRQ
jgi:beta-N-acetylhexosaminidase